MLDGEPVYMPDTLTLRRSDTPIQFLDWTE